MIVNINLATNAITLDEFVGLVLQKVSLIHFQM